MDEQTDNGKKRKEDGRKGERRDGERNRESSTQNLALSEKEERLV